MATAICPPTLEEMEEEGFSLVWRPLVTRFSHDPDMIYWVPPLYSSHSLRSQESLAQNTSQSTTLERTRKHHSGGQEESSACPSRRESTGAAYVPDNSMSSQDGSHLYETIKGALRSQGSPGSFVAGNDSGDEQDYFFYEQEKTPEEELRHKGFRGPSTNTRDNQESFNSYKTSRTQVSPFANSSDNKSLCEDDSLKQNIRQRPTSSSSTPQNRNTTPECKMATLSGQTGRYRFNDDPEALHCWAACNLHSQATLRSEREEKVDTSQDNLSYLEQDCCRRFRHEHFTQDDDAYQLNKCLYILSVIMLLLLGVVVIIDFYKEKSVDSSWHRIKVGSKRAKGGSMFLCWQR